MNVILVRFTIYIWRTVLEFNANLVVRYRICKCFLTTYITKNRYCELEAPVWRRTPSLSHVNVALITYKTCRRTRIERRRKGAINFRANIRISGQFKCFGFSGRNVKKRETFDSNRYRMGISCKIRFPVAFCGG